jgi:transposase InsO family protein
MGIVVLTCLTANTAFAGGMVYMAAIIDWHSKAVLSHRISNTMDSQLVMSVLNDALEKHPHPEIFNTKLNIIIYISD